MNAKTSYPFSHDTFSCDSGFPTFIWHTSTPLTDRSSDAIYRSLQLSASEIDQNGAETNNFSYEFKAFVANIVAGLSVDYKTEVSVSDVFIVEASVLSGWKITFNYSVSDIN